MSNNNLVNEKKKALLAYKEKLKEDIQYYDKSIDDFRAKHKSKNYFNDGDSSDSEDFPNAIDTGPAVPELKLLQSTLKTCLQATQELTSLVVLQSEVNVLVQAPELNGEKPVPEPGTWQEVTAECRIDLVPFTIAFYMHTPNRKFAPISCRNLQISLVKSSHAVELDKSVLHTVQRPSDAVEVIRSYAAAYRSRRTTLARLVNKYASSLFMEPHPEGGFVLKCANLLEILWRLENKWSPIAPFHHRMKFDLEYMDESYVKIITQAHKQLLDPSLQTDERTLLLSKIITTCLEARGPVDSESDLESRQTDNPEVELKDKDSEVMAPPKSLPKKSKKVVGKDKNDNSGKDKIGPQKRSNEDATEENAKKLKVNESDKIDGENVKKDKNSDTKTKKNKENIDVLKNNVNKKTKSNVVEIKKKSDENTQVVKKVTKKNKLNDNIDVAKEQNNDNDKNKKQNNDDNKNKEQNKNVESKIAKKRKNENVQSDIAKNDEKDPKKVKSTEKNENKNTVNNENPTTKDKNSKMSKPNQNNDETSKNTKSKVTDELKKSDENVINADKKETNKNTKTKDPTKKVDKKTKMSIANDKKFDIITKKMSTMENRGIKPINIVNQVKATTSKKTIEDKNKTNVDVDRQKTKNIDKNANTKNTELENNTKVTEPETTKGVAISKTSIENKNSNKKTLNDVDRQKSKNTNKNVANTKNDELKSNENNKKVTELASNKNTAIKDTQTVNKVTEKHALIKNKDKITIINKNHEKTSKLNIKKPDKNIPPPHTNNKNLPKLSIKSVRNLHKSPSHKTTIKIQNIPKTTNTWNANTKMFTGNTEKENGGKTKIPLKRVSQDKNMLRISPRILTSKFKNTSQISTKNMMKNTNIPRLMKKPVPKTTQ